MTPARELRPRTSFEGHMYDGFSLLRPCVCPTAVPAPSGLLEKIFQLETSVRHGGFKAEIIAGRRSILLDDSHEITRSRLLESHGDTHHSRYRSTFQARG